VSVAAIHEVVIGAEILISQPARHLGRTLALTLDAGRAQWADLRKSD